MSQVKSFVSVALVSLALLYSSANAQVADFCRDGGCSDCPVSITGIDPYPVCAVYDSGNSLTDNYDPPFNRVGDHWETWWNIQNFTPECKTIVRSPAAVDDPGCGKVVGAFANPVCAKIDLKETYMVESCCGVDECAEATGYRRRGTNALFAGREILSKRGASTVTMALKDKSGKEIRPVAVGYAPEYDGPRDERLAKGDVNAFMSLIKDLPERRSVQQMTKRDCGKYVETKRYTTSGDTQIISNVVEGPASIEASRATTVGTSTTFSTTVGDPFGVVSATVGFEFSESDTFTVAHTLDVPDGQRAAVGFTPYLICSEGDLSDCDDGQTYHGSACTPQLGQDGNPTGEYNLVQMS